MRRRSAVDDAHDLVLWEKELAEPPPVPLWANRWEQCLVITSWVLGVAAFGLSFWLLLLA